jgi:phosphoserine phosphatase RsbU/P
MKTKIIPPGFARFLREQQLYIVIAVAVYAVFWAIAPTRANAIATLIYSLLLCNFVVLLEVRMERLYDKRPLRFFWIAYPVALLALTPVMVAVSTAVVFLVLAPRGTPFWPYLATSWKFPGVATLIFGIGSELYRWTRRQLERRTAELQKTVETGMVERALQDQELERAREIQQSLLPKEIPQIAGFEIAGAWEPARVVGGDYFDVIRLSDGKVGVCIADVVGKSISAALLMANVQATVRAFATEPGSPSWLCSRVNSVLCSNIAMGKFVTLFYGVLDMKSKSMVFTNAGHLRPIQVSAAGKTQELENGGALLGVFREWRYEDSHVTLAAGDRLLLFTDGIIEAANPDGEEFGDRRVMEFCRSHAGASPTELKSQLLAEVKRFCRSQLGDDATLIVIGVV